MSTLRHTAAATSDAVLLDREGGIGRITLNRPGVGNALDADAIGALATTIHTVCDDPSIRVVLITGAGRAFCVGGDITTFTPDAARLPALLDALLPPLHEAVHRLSSSGLPIVTAINGPVGGGGVGLALCGDFVLAAESMKLRCGYSAIGLTSDAGSSWFLARRAGAAKAKQLFLLNESLTAEACQALGIVDEVCTDDQLARRANELATRLCASPRKAVSRIKELVDRSHERSLDEHLALEHAYMVASGGEADAIEGISAFLEKRPPEFE